MFDKYKPGDGTLHARKTRWKKMGLTPESAAKLFADQGGVCAGCLKVMEFPSKTAHVDHNHQTGKVRGILCNACNHIVGLAKEKEDTLRRLADYIQQHSAD